MTEYSSNDWLVLLFRHWFKDHLRVCRTTNGRRKLRKFSGEQHAQVVAM